MHTQNPQETLWNQTIDLDTLGDSPTISDLPDAISERPRFREMGDVEIPEPKKDPVHQRHFAHRNFDKDLFWQDIPAFKNVDEEEFRSWSFQNKYTITKFTKLEELLKDVVDEGFLADVAAGLHHAPMNLRLSPYLLSLIDWDNPIEDPIRIQFLPVASTFEKDHPLLSLDSLHEVEDSPARGLVHRYPDKALFLPLDICPVYCRFCTRSYAIGNDTDTVEKHGYQINSARWQQAFAYIASRPELEDIVVSGGDTYMLSPNKLKEIGETLLEIPHVRRIRIATKGPAVMPMKILTHTEWTETLVGLVDKGRKMHKEVCLHTHFNSENEITRFSKDAMHELFRKGVTVRNQSVMLRGVNDDALHMKRLVRRLSFMGVQPYYVYQHDMVSGVEELRTSLTETQEIERTVRGTTAGFNTPTFVNDVPGGGGKRDLHSFEYYNRETGVSVYRSPSVRKDAAYLYFDPISKLPESGKERWKNPAEHEKMAQEALEHAGMRLEQWVR
jgi:lysine 2,3-aminomutase